MAIAKTDGLLHCVRNDAAFVIARSKATCQSPRRMDCFTAFAMTLLLSLRGAKRRGHRQDGWIASLRSQ